MGSAKYHFLKFRLYSNVDANASANVEILILSIKYQRSYMVTPLPMFTFVHFSWDILPLSANVITE